MTTDRRPRADPAIRPDGTLRPDTYRDDPETGCRIWLLSLSKSSTPQGTNETTIVSVRAELWRLHHGTPLTIGAGARCGNQRCVAVAHIYDGLTPHLSLDQQATIDRLAGRLATAQIAAQVGASAYKVVTYLKRQQVAPRGSTHPAARRYAGRPLPPRPPGFRDRAWEVFVSAGTHTYGMTSEAFAITRQAVAFTVIRVLAAIDDEQRV